MKKFLLFSFAFCIMFGAIAQNKYAARDMSKLTSASKSNKLDSQDFPFIPALKPTGAHTKANAQLVGTSGNIYTCIEGTSNWLDVDPSTNTIMFYHRAGGAWGGSSGTVRGKFTSDNGTSWDSIQYITDGTNLMRYPNGVLYNPGTTNPNELYSVVCGPVTTGSWTHNYFHSQTLGETNLSMTYIPVDSVNVTELVNLCGGNGNYHIMGKYYTTADGYTHTKVRSCVYNPNTNVFDWGTPKVVKRLFKKRIFSNGASNFCSAWNTAFAADGINGYAFCMGADSLNDPYQGTGLPLVWRTWDAGATWGTYAPGGCFHTLSNLTDQIWPTIASFTSGGPLVFRPFFEAGTTVDDNVLPGVVDYLGNLHIACIVEGKYSSHVDSLDYGFANHPFLLFDAYMTNTPEGWDVRFIDTIYTQIMDAANSGFGTGTSAEGWEHMIHMSRSEDGKNIFVTWTDTDPLLGDTVNSTPDIKGRAWNVETNMATPVVNFTNPNGGMYFFIQTPDVVLKSGSTFQMPLTYVDVWESGDPLVAQSHYFVNDLTFNESDFTVPYPNSIINPACFISVSDQNVSNLLISQNYPNPAKDITTINVKLTESSNVSVVVTNMVGQTVTSINKGRLSSGSHDISINVNNLQSGIYFYTVKAGVNTITKKMIVE